MTVEPGDLVLAQSAGLAFGLARRITSPSSPATAAPSTSTSRARGSCPPQFADGAERAGVVRDIEEPVQTPYDVRRTLQLVAGVLLRRFAGASASSRST